MLLFLVLVVNSVQFQILRSHTLLLKLPILMCSSRTVVQNGGQYVRWLVNCCCLGFS